MSVNFHGKNKYGVYSVLDENMYGLFQSWVIESMRIDGS